MNIREWKILTNKQTFFLLSNMASLSSRFIFLGLLTILVATSEANTSIRKLQDTPITTCSSYECDEWNRPCLKFCVDNGFPLGGGCQIINEGEPKRCCCIY